MALPKPYTKAREDDTSVVLSILGGRCAEIRPDKHSLPAAAVAVEAALPRHSI